MLPPVKLKKLFKTMAKIIVNGISRRGSTIQIVNNKVIIDGVDSTPEGKAVSIEITGDIDKLDVDVCQTINVHGSVGALSNTSGDILVGGDVKESINSTSGDITCSNVHGSIKTTSGDVSVTGEVAGPITTKSGDVTAA